MRRIVLAWLVLSVVAPPPTEALVGVAGAATESVSAGGPVPPPRWAPVSAGLGAGPPEKPVPGGPPGAVLEGELLVRFAPGLARSAAAAAHDSAGGRLVRRIPGGVELVRVPPGSVAEAIRRYRAHPGVREVEPNVARPPLDPVPTDPRYQSGALWGLENQGQEHPVADPPPDSAPGTPDADIDAEGAWAVTTGSSDVVVAVIDTGADLDHPDLAPSLWVNPGEVPDNGVDDDGNGYVDDVHGWDFRDRDGAPQDAHGHGTHVAGTIAAAWNDEGISGVCPGCRLMILRFAYDLATELEAIAYARAMGADVINASFGGPSWSRLERRALGQAGQAGILSVIAAGNDSLDNDLAVGVDTDGDGSSDRWSPMYPASYDLPSILSVAASNHHDEYAYATGCHNDSGDGLSKSACAFSSWGHDSVDLAAPGTDVVSALPDGTYGVWNGTSMAAPHVAGVAGLVRSVHPGDGPEAVKNRIMNGVDRDGLPLNQALHTILFPDQQTGTFTRTGGRLNAAGALAAPATEATPVTDGSIGGAKRLRNKARGRVSWPEDVNDVFWRKLVRGRRYRITLVVPAGKDFDLYLWSRKTQEIWQWGKLIRSSTGGPGSDETFTFRPKRTGRWYVHVASWFSHGRYRLRARCLSC